MATGPGFYDNLCPQSWQDGSAATWTLQDPHQQSKNYLPFTLILLINLFLLFFSLRLPGQLSSFYQTHYVSNAVKNAFLQRQSSVLAPAQACFDNEMNILGANQFDVQIEVCTSLGFHSEALSQPQSWKLISDQSMSLTIRTEHTLVVSNTQLLSSSDYSKSQGTA
jgi:hypothetical protein